MTLPPTSRPRSSGAFSGAMGVLGVADLKNYSDYLRSKPAEVATLANDMMINVTGFFRDPAGVGSAA